MAVTPQRPTPTGVEQRSIDWVPNEHRVNRYLAWPRSLNSVDYSIFVGLPVAGLLHLHGIREELPDEEREPAAV